MSKEVHRLVANLALLQMLQVGRLISAGHQNVVHVNEDEVHVGPQPVNKALEGVARVVEATS